MRGLLLFDVLANDCDGSAATASGKKLWDQSTRPQSFLRISEYFFLRIRRLETPFRLFTKAETATFFSLSLHRCIPGMGGKRGFFRKGPSLPFSSEP